MKKIFKVLSIASLVSVLAVTSGCSCKASKKSTNEVTEKLAASQLGISDGKSIDYVAIFESSQETEILDIKTVYTIKRDVNNDIYIFQANMTEIAKNGEKRENPIYNKKLYKLNGKVYLKELDSKDNGELIEYSTPYYAFQELDELEMYRTIITQTYDSYKTVPLNACSTEGNKEKVYDIYTPSSELLECSAKKKLFKKEYTYEIGYNTSLIEWDEVKVGVNKDNLMTNLEVVKKLADNSSTSYSLEIDYSDIDLTK